MIKEFLNDLKHLMGLGGFLFIAGLLLQDATLFLIGFWFVGFTFIVDHGTRKAYERAKSKNI